MIKLSDFNWKTLVNMYHDPDKGMIQTYRVKNKLIRLESGVITEIKEL